MTKPFLIEDGKHGRTLVVTGSWSDDVERALSRENVDALQLNYARGFTDHRLDFLKADWGLRGLDILDRAITDLGPIKRLSETLERLSVQAAPEAQLELSGLPNLRHVAGEWLVLKDTLAEVPGLRELITWKFIEQDLGSFRTHPKLERLTIKEARRLLTLAGVNELRALTALAIFLAPRLTDTSDVAALSMTLQELQLEDCPAIAGIDDVAPLANLRFLNISDCRALPSLDPLRGLLHLERFHAWGSTRIVNGDLSPLAALPNLVEIRMQDRRGYRPRLAELKATISTKRS